jgi:hypothetical protein
LHQDRCAPPWRLVGVSPEVIAKTGGFEVLSGHNWAVRAGEVEGAWHRLEADGVVVHV